METFELTSSAFAHGETIPVTYTCSDADMSPPLSWSDAPEGTRTFALICEDPDASKGMWSHWVLYNIPANRNSLPANVVPGKKLHWGGDQGENDSGNARYNGPCPPPGKPHRYFFRMYALDAELGLEPGATREALLEAMKGHMLGQAELMGRYGREHRA
jgi:hypothetical protein